jgi:hypothetical protein
MILRWLRHLYIEYELELPATIAASAVLSALLCWALVCLMRLSVVVEFLSR